MINVDNSKHTNKTNTLLLVLCAPDVEGVGFPLTAEVRVWMEMLGNFFNLDRISAAANIRRRLDAMMQVSKGGGPDVITTTPTTSLKFSQLPPMLFDSLTHSHGATFSAAQSLKHISTRTSEMIKIHRQVC